MQVDELASLSNIQKVANELGLSYNNDNITRYLDTLMALRITSTVNQKVAVKVRCVYK